MNKVKIKVTHSEVVVLHDLLLYFCNNRQSCCRHDLESMQVALVQMLLPKLYLKTVFVFYKQKTLGFNIAEGFAIKQSLDGMQTENAHTNAVRLTIIMELGKQLPR